MIAALLITLSLAAPTTLTGHGGRAPHAPAVAKKANAGVVLAERVDADPNSPDREPGFVDHYMPYSLSAQALPAVKDGMVLSHVLGYLLYGICGSLWGPIVSVDGAEFSGDVVISWFLSGLIYGLIAGVASFTGIGLLVWLAIPYLQGTAVLNAIDRGMKAKGYKPPPKGTTPNPSNPANPPTTGDTPPPSYAY